MDNWLKPYIEKLQNIFEINEYDQFVTDLYEILMSKEYPNEKKSNLFKESIFR